MKIAISGAHGVGKTTLAGKLAKALALPQIEEVVRSVARDFGFRTTGQIQKSGLLDKCLFQNTLFVRQAVTEMQFKNGFVSDRSMLDFVAYCYLYNLPDHYVEILQKEALRHSEFYDLLVYCPIPDVVLENDGFRLTDKDSQKVVDAAIRGLLNEAECPVIGLGIDRSSWEREVLEVCNLPRIGS